MQGIKTFQFQNLNQLKYPFSYDKNVQDSATPYFN